MKKYPNETEENVQIISSKYNSYEWDVFISHASEDKEEIVRPLAEELNKKGIKVWYDEFSLSIGDSLREKIDEGLAKSRFGVIILSENFFSKKWTMNELDALFTLEIFGEKVILPVLHNMDLEELKEISPMIVPKLVAKTENGLDSVVSEILKAMASRERKIALELENLKRDRLKLLLNDLNIKYGEKIKDKTEIGNIKSKYIEPDIKIRINEALDEQEIEDEESPEQETYSLEPDNEIGANETPEELEIEDEETAEQETYFYKSISLDKVLMDNKDYVIVGEAGIGKTSILYWMGMQITNNNINSDFIPLFIPLKSIANKTTKDELFSIIETRYNIKKYYLNDYKILFLLDGLDQLDDYFNIRERLKEKDIFGNNNKIIFTTRPTGYEWIKSEIEKKDKNQYEFLKILPFDDERIERYMGDKYSDEQFQELFNINKELISIPILLKLVKELLLENKLFQIKNRTDLYDKFIEYLIEKWEKSKKGNRKSSIDALKIKKDLPDISYKALEDKFIGSVPFEKAGEYIENIDDLEILISWSVTHNLGEKEGDDVFFYTHQSFQEYFASLKLKEELFKNSELNQNILFEKIEYAYWDEVWLFMLNKLPNEKLKKIIEVINEHDSFLAARCIIEYKGNKKDFQKIINKILNESEYETNFQNIASQLIGEIGLSENIDDLIPLLNDEHWVVRGSAAKALGKIGSSENVKDLIPLLKDDNNDVQISSKEAIKKIINKVDLISLLKNDSWSVRSSAAEIMGEIGTSKNIKYLIPLINDYVDIVRSSAIESIRKIVSKVNIDDLIPLLKDDNFVVRGSAAEAIGEIGSNENIKDLIPLLEDKYWDVRASAAEAIGEIGSSENVKDLIPLLEESWEVQSKASEAIRKIVSKSDINNLIPLLKDENWYVRLSTSEAMGEIGSSENVKDLIPLLKDEDSYDVQESAAKALMEIGSSENVKDLIPLIKDADYDTDCLAKIIEKIGSNENVKDLIPLLKDEEGHMRYSAAEIIGEIGTSENVKDLIPLLKDEHWVAQSNASEAIGKIGSSENVKDLIPLLKDDNFALRASVTEAIGKIGTSENIDDLNPLLKDDDWRVRINAVEAIVKIVSKSGIDNLIPLLEDEMWGVRRNAAEAIGEIGSSENVKDLIPLLKDKDKNVQISSFESIIKILTHSDSDEQDKIINEILESDLSEELIYETLEIIKKFVGRKFLKIKEEFKEKK